MSKGFSINDILGNTKANAPAGQKMQVVMLPAADIEPNPENSIYEIGDVSMLKADIAERGLRSPLEVLPAQNGKYMLLAGHRRWTACRLLTAEGVAGFEVLPCVIRQSQGEDDDLIALITSNATARELTDGERLRQYRALKQALERKKAAGALDGRIRDEMSRITGDGTGTLGRFNAILNNCTAEVVEMLEKGKITMTRAYECSNWCHRVMEWQVPVHLQDLNGSGKYIGASAVQGRKVYGIKVSKPQTLFIKRTEAAT